MSVGKYKRSYENIKKLRVARLGKTYEELFGREIAEKLKKQHSKKMKGFIFSKERSKKISKALKGKKLSDEHRIKLSNSHKGKIFSEKHKKSLSIAGMGRKSSKKTCMKISKSNMGRIVSEKTRNKIRNTLLKEESLKKIKEKRRSQILPLTDTKIEVKIQNFLRELGIEFATHQYMKDIKYKYQCDIFIPKQEGIPQKIVIECDGDYWHGNLEVFNMDKLSQKIKERRCLNYERTAQLEKAGFRVIRLWENRIKKMELNNLVNRICH